MSEPVTVHYWPIRLNMGNKSLTGHVALETMGVYASWAPTHDTGVDSAFRPVYPQPRSDYDRDLTLTGGVPSKQILIHGLNAEAIRAKWVGQAAHMADPAVHGPPIGYQLVPAAEKGAASSCATLVVKLLLAGGADKILPWKQSHLVTPGDVFEYATKLAAARRI